MKITGYYVDVSNETVTEVALTDDYRDIYKFLHCDCFTTVRLNTEMDSLFVDDNGLFKPGNRLFQLQNYPQLLSGNGLVLGMRPDGETAAPAMDFNVFRQMIGFTDQVIA